MRSLPKNRQAEQIVLGALLVDSDAVRSHFDEVLPDWFYWKSHQAVYRAVCQLWQQDVFPDLVTVGETLERSGNLAGIGGRVYLAELTNALTTISSVPHYLRIVRTRAQLRQIIALGEEVVQGGYDHRNINDVLQLIERQSCQIKQQTASSRGMVPIKQAVDRLQEHLVYLRDGRAGLKTGIKPLDDVVKFLPLPSYTFIFARPKSGKTMLALNIALNVAQAGKQVAYISLEMPMDQLQERLLKMLGNHTNADLHDETKRTEIQRTVSKLSNLKLTMYEGNSQLSALKNAIHHQVVKEQCELVVLENLDHIMLDQKVSKLNEKFQMISTELSTFTKDMGREGFPFALILLGQANRDTNNSKDGFPLKSNVAGTDQVARDCDLALGLADPEACTSDQLNHIGIKVVADRHGVTSYEPIWISCDKEKQIVGLSSSPF